VGTLAAGLGPTVLGYLLEGAMVRENTIHGRVFSFNIDLFTDNSFLGRSLAFMKFLNQR
jgi:hypothetical protein